MRKEALIGNCVVVVIGMQETWVSYLHQEDPMEKEMATHSCILVWEMPWTEEPGRLQSMGSKIIG